MATSIDWTILGGTGGFTVMEGLPLSGAGSSISISENGKIVAVGEAVYNSSGGRVIIYELIEGVWVPKGSSGSIVGISPEAAGASVSLSNAGNIVAVGGPGYSETTSTQGRVRVFEFIEGATMDWVLKGGATSIIGEQTGDNSGRTVAISGLGNVIAVGEPDYDITNSGGRVRVFEFIEGVTMDWVLKGSATAMIGADIDKAGSSVSISDLGDIVAFGEPGFESFLSTGRARVFEFIEGATMDWVLKGGATSMIGDSPGHQAGFSVALSGPGDVIVVGEPNYDGGGAQSGRARVYSFTGGDWMPLGGATAIVGELWEQTGSSVAISTIGDIIAVGKPKKPSGKGVFPGIGKVNVYNFDDDDDDWELQGSDTAMISGETGDGTGEVVDISGDGNIVAFGEPNYNSNAGRARVYQFLPDVVEATGTTGDQEDQPPTPTVPTPVPIPSISNMGNNIALAVLILLLIIFGTLLYELIFKKNTQTLN